MGESFMTSRGVRLEFLPIQTLLDKLNAQHQANLPKPPTYEVKTAMGGVEVHVHDATTVQTDEEKAALVQYEQDVKAATAQNNERLTRLILLRGVQVEMPEGDEWVKEQAFLGITVPDDPLEKKLHWLTTEALAGVEDLEAVTLGVLRASGVPEDLLAQMEAAFRRSVGKPGGAETLGASSRKDGARVVLQPPVRRSGRRGQKPHARQRV